MAINSVKTIAEEQSFKFLENQSSILRTVDTNNITYNGVNVIVDKPKVGDVMCVTRYTDNKGSLLESYKQKVFFVSGSSIYNMHNLTHNDMNQVVFDTVGIVLKVMGNKALVRYKKVSDQTYSYCAIARRFQLADSVNVGGNNTGVDALIVYIQNGVRPTVNIVTSGSSTISLKIGEDSTINYNNYTRRNLVNELNHQLVTKYEFAEFSFDLVNTDSDAHATNTTDAKDSKGKYQNRVVLNSTTEVVSINYTGAETNAMNIPLSNVTANYLKMSNLNQIYFLNSGFTRYSSGGCCRAALYDTGKNEGKEPTSAMTNINVLPGVGEYLGEWLVSPSHFTNSSNCQILRNNFANYDEYIDSLMIKVPCNAITENNGNATAIYPSGKENTSKLAAGVFSSFGQSNKLEHLYPAAYYAASLNVNGPGLTEGNWWLPSGAEMVEIMKDATLGTTTYNKEGQRKTLVETLCVKFSTQCPSEWSALNTQNYYITSDIKLNSIASVYEKSGILGTKDIYNFPAYVIPVTIYEF